MAHPAALILLCVVFPLWVAAGFADWACHRATRIEATSGVRENILHWVMFAEVGVGVLAVVLLEVNAAVLLVVLGVFVVHELTVWIDLRYTVPRRRVTPLEQMVHSFQEVFPLLSLALLSVLAWDQALALAGSGTQPADLGLRWKREPLPAPVLLAGLAMVALLNALPLAQETWTCLRARRPS